MKFKLLLLSTFSCLFFASQSSLAQHFVSPSYIIDWGNFNITSGRKSSTNYSLTDTVGQNAPGQYTSTGYRVKAGFQYIYDLNNQFTFSIDNLAIDLETLVPGVATTATNIITITTPSGQGYQIMAQENHPLSLISGTTIPDTACNIGSTCTDSASNVWDSLTAYGFGFNAIGINGSGTITGIGTSDYFLDPSYYRPFVNSAAVPPRPNQIIMSENTPTTGRSARISYKANISTAQASGNYQNAIIFTAVPKY